MKPNNQLTEVVERVEMVKVRKVRQHFDKLIFVAQPILSKLKTQKSRLVKCHDQH